MTRHSNSAPVIWGMAALFALLLFSGWLVNLGTLPGSTLPPGIKTAGVIVLGLVIAGLSVFAVSGLLHLFTRWFPIARAYELTYTQADWENFQRLSRISVIFTLSLVIAFTLPFKAALLLLARGYASLVPGLFVIQICPNYWTYPAIFASLVLAMALTHSLFRWRMKERFPRYLAFHNQRLGFDQRKAGRALFMFGLFFSLGLIIIGLNQYVRVDSEGLAINRFFGLVESRYAYADVIQIEEQVNSPSASALDEAAQQSFMIQFRDGRYWRSNTYTRRSVAPTILAAFEYIAQQSGIPLEQVLTNRR